jgi:hypothetical protein
MHLLFTVLALTSLRAFAWTVPQDCRANIRAAVCRVAPLTKEQENNPAFERPCLGGEGTYAAELEKVHDELPPKLQKMFCHLRRIYVEEDFYATGYASRFAEVFRDGEGKERVRFNGNVLGLSRQKVFETRYGLSEWINRKEQTLFGRKMEEPLLPAVIPQLEMDYAGVKARPMLIDVVVHEFGHMLDSAQRFNSYEISGDLEAAPRLSGLWASVSWNPDGSIRAEDRYFGDRRPCYYGCEGDKLWPLEKAAEIYREFIRAASFVSIYASVDTHEDFAESFLYYISENYLSPKGDDAKYFYSAVKFPNEDPLNLNGRDRGRIRAKMNFMAMFDAMPWKYEPEPFSISLEEYTKPSSQARY